MNEPASSTTSTLSVPSTLSAPSAPSAPTQRVLVCGPDLASLTKAPAASEAVKATEALEARGIEIIPCVQHEQTPSRLNPSHGALDCVMHLYTNGREPHADRRFSVRHKVKTHPCLLPGCDKQTSHNGGYCCAEHSRAHQKLRSN